jgi:hypothetical protein
LFEGGIVWGEISMADQELEREVLMYIPTVVEWIERGQDITEADVRSLREVVPAHFEYSRNLSFDEILKWNEKYLNEPTLKEYIKILMSDKGKDWLSRNLILLKKLSEGP